MADHDNSVIRAVNGAPGAAVTAQAFNMMDRWLTAIEADTARRAIEQKVVSNKPADVHDGCYANSGATAADLTTELTLTDPACPVAVPLTYTIAETGGRRPRGEDVFKCQFKAFDPASADYGGAVFSAGQVTRLKAVFPDGVCDWTKPGSVKRRSGNPRASRTGRAGP